MKLKTLLPIMLLAVILIVTGCKATPQNTGAVATPSPTPTAIPLATDEPDLSNDTLEKGKTINITIEMQDGGVIKAELYPEIAPITVANFTKLIEQHFYDGLIFHRVIPGFMIQGGGYTINNEQKNADPIKGEFSENGVENNLKHTRGTLSMARTNVPDSASSQFFIMHADYPSLNNKYAAFGKVTSGMDVVDKIASAETTTLNQMFQNYPVAPAVIKTITIDK